MCGRFVVDDTVWREMERLVGEIACSLPGNGDVFPSAQVPILKRKPDKGQNAKGSLACAPARWGYPGCGKGRALINARAESVQEKPSFRADFAQRRCVILARGFYEWNAKKEKFYFAGAEPVLYLAGIYNNAPGEECVTILTTQANESVRPVHDRMPLLLSGDEIIRWVEDRETAARILKKQPPSLDCRKIGADYEQLSLF